MDKTTPLVWTVCMLVLVGCGAEHPPAVAGELRIQVASEIPITDPITMTLYEVEGDATLPHPGRVQRRGGFSISFPKHSYEIDLDEDIPLGGLPDDDDWILNANYIDKTFMRHVLAYDLFREMHPDNRAAHYRFVNLYLNDEYNGLYVLMEKLDKSSLRVKGKDPESVIFKEPPVFITDPFTPQNPENYYQQTHPKRKDRDKSEFIAGVKTFIETTDDAVFAARVGQVFDIRNIIDWHLLLLLLNNSDGVRKNFYLYKVDARTPLRIAPWDYDHAMGRDGDNELNMIRPLDPTRASLIRRLMALPTYRQALAQRWRQLNAPGGLFTPDALEGRVNQLQRQLLPLVGRNFERWPTDGPRYYDANSFEQEVDIIRQFFKLRHPQVAAQMEGF